MADDTERRGEVRTGDYRCTACGMASFVASTHPDGLCKWCRE